MPRFSAAHMTHRMTAAVLAAALLLAGCGSSVHRAARNNDASAIRALAQSGADLDAPMDPIDRWTPVEMAAYGGHKEALLALLDGGAKPELGRHRSDIEPRHPELIKFIEERAAGKLPPPPPLTLCKALIKGNRDASSALLDRGVDPNARIDNGYTLFNCAIQSRRTDLVQLLLDRGTKRSSAFDSPGWGRPTDMQLAQNMGLHEIVALFTAEPRKSPGNLDDDAYNRMRTAAALPPEKKELFSDIDAPSRRGAERSDDFALVIGVEEYQTLPKAEFGARDAKTVRLHLEALGFPSRNIISLTGSEATGSKLRSYLEEWLPLNVKETSTLFVYYSGHGAPDVKTGDAYLVPWDGDPKFLKSTALPLTKLYSDLSKTKAKRVIVALDACFSGAGGRSVLAKGARPLIAKIADTAPTGGNLTVLAAASGDEITGSLDEHGHGMFTYHLLKGLTADPKASAKSLFQYVMPRVQDDARRQNRVQTPVLAGASLDEPLLR